MDLLRVPFFNTFEFIAKDGSPRRKTFNLTKFKEVVPLVHPTMCLYRAAVMVRFLVWQPDCELASMLLPPGRQEG